MTFVHDSFLSHKFHSCEYFTHMISFMIYYWLRYVAGDSIRESPGLGLWEDSPYKGD